MSGASGGTGLLRVQTGVRHEVCPTVVLAFTVAWGTGVAGESATEPPQGEGWRLHSVTPCRVPVTRDWELADTAECHPGTAILADALVFTYVRDVVERAEITPIQGER